MRFSSLIPREEKFFDMFDDMVSIVARTADQFLALVTEFDRLPERSVDLKKEEHAADEVVERILQALDRSFVTPFDREDIHALATSLDDVVDNMEETGHRFTVFRIERPTQEARALAGIVRECCTHLEAAVRLLRDVAANAERIQTHLREISRLENDADKIYRDQESALFATPPDLLTLIKLRELYSRLEETVDSCRAAANVISGIVIKGT
jgi:predicted phosphate transport protein (TIGR00153 family)